MVARLPAAGLLLVMFATVPTVHSQEKAPTKGPKLPDGVTAHRNLAYATHGERNTLDLYVPKADGPLPLVIWIHGGGWQAGSKDGGGPALMLLTKGYAVASINYRLSQQAVFPAQIEDCKAAVRYLRANAKTHNLNPDAFGVWGASAGGHLVALLGTSGDAKELNGDGPNKDVSSRVQAVCDFFGPTDLLKLSGGAADSPITKLLGGKPADKKELAVKADPITYATKDDAPVLIVHGDKDTLVPLDQSEILVAGLKKAGVEVELVVVKGGGHGGPGFASAENQAKIAAFFDKHLKGRK